jgi:hypothetical protein
MILAYPYQILTDYAHNEKGGSYGRKDHKGKQVRAGYRLHQKKSLQRMSDKEKSPGMLGLLRDVISIAGTFGGQHIVYAQFFGIGRIFRIIQK